MLKKSLAIIVVSLLVLVILFTVFLYAGEKEMPLNSVSLTLQGLNEEGFEAFDEEYITESYIAPSSTLFAGWNILEKYHIRFSKNDSCFIINDLGKLTTENKCKEFISKIRTTNFIYNFTEIESEVIGDESYIGKNITNNFGVEYSIYFIVFRIDTVVVALMCSQHTKDTSVNYAKVIESNILIK